MQTTTELKLPQEHELTTYLDDYVRFYQRVWRRVYEDFINGVFENDFGGSLNEYTKMIRVHYGILTRTANSIVRDVKGRLKALLALKKTQLYELEERIKRDEEKLERLKEKVRVLKQKAKDNLLDEKELEKLRKLKFSLYEKTNALERKRKKRDKWIHQVETGRVTLTFGSKKLFCAQFHLKESGFKDFGDWKEAHDHALNHNILFLGRIDEKRGNQIVQLTPLEDGSFNLKLSKDLPFRKEGEPSFIEAGGLKIKYLGDLIRKIVTAETKNQGKGPVTCRFHKREGRGWYLQIMVETEKKEPFQFESDGVFSIDYNDGMLAVAELSWDGNLTDAFTVVLKSHGCGGRALAEIRDVAKELAVRAYDKGKPVVIEDLDFKKTKAVSGKNRRYNKMIHSFDYSRFRETLQRACERNGVKFMAVNPAYTTKIGVEKFKDRMKLSDHLCAAFEIGRRAQGRKDRLRKVA